MKFIRLHKQELFSEGCVLTWGSFDGVHLGHQSVLSEVKEHAAKLQLPSVVLITEPLAKEYFALQNPDNASHNIPARLTGFRERVELLAQQNIDYLVCLPFNANLANTSAEDYVEQILLKQLNVKHVVLGDDTRFGAKRKGDVNLLKSMSTKHGFAVSDIATQQQDASRISSTRIRELLQAGKMAEASALLGHEYYIAGRVVHGEKRGRQLGFPTANFNIKRRQSPLLGVYAVELYNTNTQERLMAVANIGMRPTFGGKFCLLEVHVLDFNGDLYGQHMQVVFKHKIREEMQHASFLQIARDFMANNR